MVAPALLKVGQAGLSAHAQKLPSALPPPHLALFFSLVSSRYGERSLASVATQSSQAPPLFASLLGFVPPTAASQVPFPACWALGSRK